MTQANSNRRPGRVPARVLARLLRALLAPFRGASPGATQLEYMIVTGFVALFAILAVNRFGKTLHKAYKAEAEHVRGKGAPGAADLLGSLGGLSDPTGSCIEGIGCFGGCFAAGTPVSTETGDRPIETLLAGERVWARDIATGAVALRTVTRTWIRERAPVITLELQEDSLGRERLKVTPDHRFWVEGTGWVQAGELSGVPLWSTEASVAATALVDTPLEVTTVYNLAVDGYNTYFVGHSRALVHNQNPQPGPFNCGAGLPNLGLPDLGLPDPTIPGFVPGGTPANDNAPTPNDPDPKKLECGDLGTYKDLNSQRAEQSGSLARDHIPSKGALLMRAEELFFGKPLRTDQEKAMGKAFEDFKKAIDDSGLTIAIPSRAHQQISHTYGQTDRDQMAQDGRDLAGAAQRDLDALRNGGRNGRPGLDAYLAGLSPEDRAKCLAQFESAASQVQAMTQAEYEQALWNAINSLPPETKQQLEEARDRMIGG